MNPRWKTSLLKLDILESKHAGWILFLLAAILVFRTLGLNGLEDWDEAIYASVARQIYLTGDLVHLSLNGDPYFNKPPLFMALTSLSYAAFGVDEFSARFVSAVFGVLDIMLAYLLIRRLFGGVEASLTVVLLLSTLRYLRIIQHGRMESMVAFFIILAVYALARLREGGIWVYVFAAASALGVLTKGAMGLMPLFIAAPFIAIYKPSREHLSIKRVVAGAIVFLAIALPWYVLFYINNGQGFTGRFIGYETVERVARAIEGHEGSPIFYLMGFVNTSAWGFLIPVSMPFMVYRAFKSRSEGLILMSIFLIVPFAIFSFAVKTKIHWYAFTMYVPAAFSAVYLLKELKGKLAYLKYPVFVAVAVLIISYNLPSEGKRLALKELGPSVASTLKDGDSLIAYRMPFQTLHFYTNRKVLSVDERNELGKHPGGYVIINNKDLQGLVPGETIFENGEYILVKLPRQKGNN